MRARITEALESTTFYIVESKEALGRLDIAGAFQQKKTKCSLDENVGRSLCTKRSH